MRKYLVLTVIGVLIFLLEDCMSSRSQNNSYVSKISDSNSSGWVEESEEVTWTYVSADAPSFVISVNEDATGYLMRGMRVRLTQTTVKYAIITGVGSYTGGGTLITVFGGTDYTITNAEISDPAYSSYKAPFGFSQDPEDWSVEVTGGDPFIQNSPTQFTWYTTGIEINVPIGTWRLLYVTHVGIETTGIVGTIQSTLSTESDSSTNLVFLRQLSVATPGDNVSFSQAAYGEDIIFLETKTTYYINIRTTTGADVTNISSGYYLVRAVSAYL